MAKYESQIKAVPYSQSAVYAKISDLTNLAVIREKFEPAGPIGGTITVQIVDREPEKCVKFSSTQSPVGFKVWIQMLPTSEITSKIKVTIDADLNFFMKQMLDSHLKKGVDKFADMLAMIPYE